MRIRTISDFRSAMRNGRYAWPGGYPLYFVMADGEAMSFAAARENRRLILEALARPYRHMSDWRPVAVDVNFEDADLACVHTGERIESAYAG